MAAALPEGFNLNQPITAGLDEDIETAIFKIYDKFEDATGPSLTDLSWRFQVFVEVWRETQLGLIFNGRESFREMYEFTEELFHRVKRYAVSCRRNKPNHTLVRYAALYMLYSLYFKQPCRPMVKIRLTMQDFQDLQALTAAAKLEAHWDVMYAWAKLFTGHAFHYVACEGQMGLEVALQMETKDTAERQQRARRENYFQSKQFLSMMRKMGRAQAKYEGMKRDLASREDRGDSSLFFTDPNIADTLRKVVTGVGEEDGSGVVRSGRVSRSVIGDKRRNLKYKFYEGGREAEESGQEADWSPAVRSPARGGGKAGTRPAPATPNTKGEEWAKKTPRGRGRGRGSASPRGRGRGSPSSRGRWKRGTKKPIEDFID